MTAASHLRKASSWIRWEPTADTVVAVITAICMIPLYFLSVHAQGILNTVATIAQMVFLAVIVPVWYLVWHRKRPLSELGITGKYWLPSLLTGIALSAFMSVQLFSTYTGTELLPHLLVNACMFWEPFFVFGWLLLCFDRAFGIIPGILFSAIAFGSYHLGTYPIVQVAMLITMGIFFGLIFRITGNLLILWPFAWMISSGIGTALGGMVFGWDSVLTSAAILIISLAFIGYTAWKIPTRQMTDGSG